MISVTRSNCQVCSTLVKIREIFVHQTLTDHALEDANDAILFNQYSENETKIWRQNILNQFNRVSSSCLRSHFVISLLSFLNPVSTGLF